MSWSSKASKPMKTMRFRCSGIRVSASMQGSAPRVISTCSTPSAARAKQVKILPLCPYAKKMMCGKEEYQDVL